ncbi:MAG: hypothetical protein ACRDQB_18540 [Thermocrispum sp.]
MLFAALGLVVVAVGSFLPWVSSGAALRSSFETAGVLERLGPSDQPLLDAALTGWIAIPLVCVICLGLYTVGMTRTGAGIATIVSLLAGTVGAATYVIGNGGSGAVSVVATGPLTTCLGGVVALGGSLGALVARRVRPTASHGTAA